MKKTLKQFLKEILDFAQNKNYHRCYLWVTRFGTGIGKLKIHTSFLLTDSQTRKETTKFFRSLVRVIKKGGMEGDFNLEESILKFEIAEHIGHREKTFVVMFSLSFLRPPPEELFVKGESRRILAGDDHPLKELDLE